MSFDQANHGAPNPNFIKGGGYRKNCQSCVVCYEARLRGYDAETLPNTPGSFLEKLSYNTNMAWVDSHTGQHPQYVCAPNIVDAHQYYHFLSRTVGVGERYTFQYIHKTSSFTGHIISLSRTDAGELMLYDPQVGTSYLGELGITDYLRHRVAFGSTIVDIDGIMHRIDRSPKLLRVDNMSFYLPIVNNIMKRSN